MFTVFKKLRSPKDSMYSGYGIRVFTYYLPAPPPRKTGYQEKEFDLIMTYLQNLGFEILDLKLESHNHDQGAGLWAVCILGAPTKDIYNIKLDIDYNEIAAKDTSSSNLNDQITYEA